MICPIRGVCRVGKDDVQPTEHLQLDGGDWHTAKAIRVDAVGDAVGIDEVSVASAGSRLPQGNRRRSGTRSQDYSLCAGRRHGCSPC